MFFPSDLLKKGGRFYLCWVADSWPLRFATITQRQLASQDLRKLCDELLIVMNRETGRSTQRFSLRLSSQLLRGLVRLYQRKATLLLSDLCMINASVLKQIHKKWGSDDEDNPRPVAVPRAAVRNVAIEPELDPREERVEEMIQQSNNVVRHIQDITLKELAIPEIQLPNDNFGEENPDQALQLLTERSLEQMLAAGDASIQHSAIDAFLLDITNEKSRDKSRIGLPAQMERISELDVTMSRKSIAMDLQAGDFEKDFPQIPDIPYPEESFLQQEKQQDAVEPANAVDVLPPQQLPHEPEKESEKFELEELEEPVAKRRKLKNKLMVDSKTKLSSNLFRSRLENIHVELRCEDSGDDVIEIKVPSYIYFRRPAHAGCGIRSKIADNLTRQFLRNLESRIQLPYEDTEMEEALAYRRQVRSIRFLDMIVEEPNVERQEEQEMVRMQDLDATMQNISVPRVSKEQDISEMLTQKLESPSQETNKRKRSAEDQGSSRRPRLSGYVSFDESRRAQIEMEPPLIEAHKENVPPISDNIIVAQETTQQQQDTESSIATMLQAAGLADIQHKYQEIPQDPNKSSRNVEKTTQRTRSESSETQLGSLDRTKVSLGDSDKTTDSKGFIRDNWGTEATMMRIIKCIYNRKTPVTVENLILNGPVISGHKKIILAKCFTSILKLKQHGFVRVKKDHKTLEITDLTLGPSLDSC